MPTIKAIQGDSRTSYRPCRAACRGRGAGSHDQLRVPGGATRSITDPSSRTNALAEVAGALARAGQYQQAEATARSITDANRQADALAMVAEALARGGQTRSGSRMAVIAYAASQ